MKNIEDCKGSKGSKGSKGTFSNIYSTFACIILSSDLEKDLWKDSRNVVTPLKMLPKYFCEI